MNWGCSGQGRDRVFRDLFWTATFLVYLVYLLRGSSGFVLTELPVSLSPAPPGQEDLITGMKSLCASCQHWASREPESSELEQPESSELESVLQVLDRVWRGLIPAGQHRIIEWLGLEGTLKLIVPWTLIQCHPLIDQSAPAEIVPCHLPEHW